MVVPGNIGFYDLQRLKEAYAAPTQSSQRQDCAGAKPDGREASIHRNYAGSKSFNNSG